MARRRIAGDAAEPADDRRFVTALARGLQVLRCFTPQDRWLSHQVLARRSGLPQATLSRLCFTLVALGYLQHQPEEGRYALGGGVLALGFSMLSNYDIGRIARPAMQALSEQAQAAVSLGLRHELQMVYVVHCRGGRLTLGLDVGARIPIGPTAMSRALLCGLPADEREALCARLRAADPAGGAALDAAWAEARADYEAGGFVRSQQLWHPEISAIGAPLVLADGRVFAMTVGGPSSWLTPARLDALGPALVDTARGVVERVHAGDVG